MRKIYLLLLFQITRTLCVGLCREMFCRASMEFLVRSPNPDIAAKTTKEKPIKFQ